VKKTLEQRQVAFEQQLKSTPLYASKPIAMAFEANILHFADDAIFTLILSN